MILQHLQNVHAFDMYTLFMKHAHNFSAHFHCQITVELMRFKKIFVPAYLLELLLIKGNLFKRAEA